MPAFVSTALAHREFRLFAHFPSPSSVPFRLTICLLSFQSGSYAYVYPSSPYNIYLCNAFWSAPMTGTDSKMVSEVDPTPSTMSKRTVSDTV